MNPLVVDAKCLDVAAVVQMLNPGTAEQVFVPYVAVQLEEATYVGIVCIVNQMALFWMSPNKRRAKVCSNAKELE